jgi:hypothetical protein
MTLEQADTIINLLRAMTNLLQWVAAFTLGTLLYKIGRG